MKILAMDSSGLTASIAVVEEDNLIAEYTIQYKKTHSQTLLPMLEEITKMVELDMHTIDAIAVAAGPGSFTGLRIGSATAKGLGFALQKPLIGIPTLEGLAYNMYGTNLLVCPIMDARRGQVYAGIYEFAEASSEYAQKNRGYRLQTIEAQCALTMDELIDKLNRIDRNVIFVGDGIPVFSEKIAYKLRVAYHLAPAHRNRQSASSIAALAQIYFTEGKIETAEEHQPNYLRLSQAERERMEKEQHDTI